MRRLELVVLAALLPGLPCAPSAVADGRLTTGKLSQRLEIPAHRRLAEIRQAPDTRLAPVTTAGCSGGLSGLWTFTAERYPAFAEGHDGVPPWKPCCVTHDRAYGAPVRPAPGRRCATSSRHRPCLGCAPTLREWLDGVSDALCISPPRLRDSRPFATAAIRSRRRLPGTTGPRVRSPWPAASENGQVSPYFRRPNVVVASGAVTSVAAPLPQRRTQAIYDAARSPNACKSPEAVCTVPSIPLPRCLAWPSAPRPADQAPPARPLRKPAGCNGHLPIARTVFCTYT